MKKKLARQPHDQRLRNTIRRLLDDLGTKHPNWAEIHTWCIEFSLDVVSEAVGETRKRDANRRLDRWHVRILTSIVGFVENVKKGQLMGTTKSMLTNRNALQWRNPAAECEATILGIDFDFGSFVQIQKKRSLNE